MAYCIMLCSRVFWAARASPARTTTPYSLRLCMLACVYDHRLTDVPTLPRPCASADAGSFGYRLARGDSAQKSPGEAQAHRAVFGGGGRTALLRGRRVDHCGWEGATSFLSTAPPSPRPEHGDIVIFFSSFFFVQGELAPRRWIPFHVMKLTLLG